MNAQSTAVQTAAKPTPAPTGKALSLSQELIELKPEIAKVLPEHITADKFLRVVNTAISQTPALYKADRRSLLTSCVKCATDGLVPDGREAALVIFKTKDGKGAWIEKVQYMPMIAGILKKMRNSGELKSITCNIVCEKDAFRYWIDDLGEHITHEPNVVDLDRGKLIAVYAILKTKDDGMFVEVMSRGQIDSVRDVSKSKDNGPWVTWFDEMARKTVMRRVSKRAPMSSDIERVIRRDDEFYDLRNARTAHASSGADATKKLLGLNTQDPTPDPVEDDIPTADEVTSEQDIARLRECGDPKELQGIWTEIVAGYKGDGGGVPLEIEAAFTECKEKLAELKL